MTAPAISEADLQDWTVALARWTGWLVHHDRPAMNASGRYVTAIQGHAGFPDLMLVRGGRIVFAELKTVRGKVTAAQQRWLDRLAATGAEVYLWRPQHRPYVERLLATDVQAAPRRIGITDEQAGRWL